MKKYNKYIAVILACMMCSAFTGCGNDDNDSEGNSKPKTSTSESKSDSNETDEEESSGNEEETQSGQETETKTEETSESEDTSESDGNEESDKSDQEENGINDKDTDIVADAELSVPEYEDDFEMNPEMSSGEQEIIDTLIKAYVENDAEAVYSLFSDEEIEKITIFANEQIEDFDENEWNEKINKDTVIKAMIEDMAQFNGYIADWESEMAAEDITLNWQNVWYVEDDEYYADIASYLDEIGLEYDNSTPFEAGLKDDESGAAEPIGYDHLMFESNGKWYLSYAFEVDYLVSEGYIDYDF